MKELEQEASRTPKQMEERYGAAGCVASLYIISNIIIIPAMLPQSGTPD